MEEKDGDEEESWLAMEQINWIENVVYVQKSDMTLVSTEIQQCGKQIIQLILASVTSRGVVNLKHWRKYQFGMKEILVVESRQIQSHQSDISAQKQCQ